MTYRKDFNVAIVGGGMCGLACAFALQQAGISVQVFEAAVKLGEVGAGVGLGTNALEALKGLGLYEEIRKRSEEPVAFRALKFVSGMENHDLVYDYPRAVGKTDIGMGVYRPVFIETIESLLKPGIINLNKRCLSVEIAADDRNIIHFSDGTCYEADVVVGADGVRSVVRDIVAPGHPAAFMNTVAYRALIPAQDLVDAQIDFTQRPICFAGIDRHLIVFPIKSGTMINVVVFDANHSIPKGSIEIPLAQWVQPATQKEMVDKFEAWGPEVKRILDLMQHPNKWCIHGLHPPLETYVHNKIVLIGDAAHAMLPHLGSGVGQGLEDAFALCKLLSNEKTTKETLKDVLQIYNSIRVPRANMVLAKSLVAGETYESYGPEKYDIDTMQNRLSGIWDDIWHHDLNIEVEEALKQSVVYK
ncbi:hypothetical protein C8J56DRAFT_851542 [Mycena floridula]|nr:hypothetical protein C8J56DRAFT_851542 [Mycena floridula]